jgi:hypothetical protein
MGFNGDIVTSHNEPMFPNATTYLNLEPTLNHKHNKKLVQKICYSVAISNNFNLDAIVRNSKAQSKVH